VLSLGRNPSASPRYYTATDLQPNTTTSTVDNLVQLFADTPCITARQTNVNNPWSPLQLNLNMRVMPKRRLRLQQERDAMPPLGAIGAAQQKPILSGEWNHLVAILVASWRWTFWIDAALGVWSLEQNKECTENLKVEHLCPSSVSDSRQWCNRTCQPCGISHSASQSDPSVQLSYHHIWVVPLPISTFHLRKIKLASHRITIWIVYHSIQLWNDHVLGRQQQGHGFIKQMLESRLLGKAINKCIFQSFCGD